MQCSIVWVVWSRSDNPVSLICFFIGAFQLVYLHFCLFSLFLSVGVQGNTHQSPFLKKKQQTTLVLMLNCFIFTIITHYGLCFAVNKINPIKFKTLKGRTFRHINMGDFNLFRFNLVLSRKVSVDLWSWSWCALA